MDAVPILAGRDRHSGYGEVFVQLVKRRRAAAAAPAHHACADFHRFVEARAVKQPVQAGDERCVRACKIHGACKHKSVGSFEFFGQSVHRVVEYALVVFDAIAAGNAAAHRLGA